METTIWMLSWHLRLSEHLCQPLSASAPGKLFLTPLWAEHWVSSHCSGYLGPTQFAKKMTPPTHTHSRDCLLSLSPVPLVSPLPVVLVVCGLISARSRVQSWET